MLLCCCVAEDDVNLLSGGEQEEVVARDGESPDKHASPGALRLVTVATVLLQDLILSYTYVIFTNIFSVFHDFQLIELLNHLYTMLDSMLC